MLCYFQFSSKSVIVSEVLLSHCKAISNLTQQYKYQLEVGFKAQVLPEYVI